MIGDILGTVLGRRRFARLARFLWLRSRLDVRNDIQTNGEQIVQEAILRRIKKHGTGTIFDVGANIGQWTSSLLDIASRIGIPEGRLELHLFEPGPAAAAVLEARIQELPANVNAILNRVGVASEPGYRKLHVMGPTAGTNSIFRSPDVTDESVNISCVTVDQYCHHNCIKHVDLCKIDAEGADSLILEGGRESLQAGIVDFVQFEYNHRWINSRRFLKDVFELAASIDWEVGKITPRGVEQYKAWDPELETFQEGNYLMGDNIASLGVPVFSWWKEVRG